MAACLQRLFPVAALCLSLAVTAHAAPSEVPAPFNLSVRSYNFNTTLHWNYSRTAESPYFQLEIWNKDKKSWDVFEHCRKVLHQYCDISQEITDPLTYYKVRVKAIIGTKESNYSKTEINLTNAGIIGPPSVNGSIQDGMILLDIWHPKVPSVVIKEYGAFNYIIYYGNTSEEVDDCDDQACSAEIELRDRLRCFSVQGNLIHLPMTIEKSDKICITDEDKVPTPFNLTITSYNFNTTLHWNYSRPAKSASFMVEILKKGQKKWTVIEACRNTFHHNCDLSFNIIEPLTYYKARVKAIVGNKESRYVLTEFTLVDLGIIGPPRVNGSIEEKMIVIDIWHPSVPPVPGKKTVRDYVPFNYIVFYGNNIEETDFCDSEACSFETPVKDELYCFFVQGKSDLPMTTEKSQRICITNEELKESSLQTAVITVLVVICVLVFLFFIGYLIRRKITKDRNKMPQSLSSVVRKKINVLPQYNQSYDTVSTTSIESPVESTVLEEQVNIDVSAQPTSNGSAYPPYQSSPSETDAKTEELGEEANHTNGYFHKVCNGGDSNNSLEAKTEENLPKQNPKPDPPREDKVVVVVVRSSFGYDKPHCPI